jgi:hypothetical protein
LKNPPWLARVTKKVSCPLPTLTRNRQFEIEKPYQSNGNDVLPKIESKRGLKIPSPLELFVMMRRPSPLLKHMP